jgi:hypothetical protein
MQANVKMIFGAYYMRAKEILSPIQLKHIKEISEELLKDIQSYELEMPGI